MPNSLVKRFAKDSNRTVPEVEEIWSNAKKQADEAFKDKPKDSHYWAFVNSQVQKKLGLKKDE